MAKFYAFYTVDDEGDVDMEVCKTASNAIKQALTWVLEAAMDEELVDEVEQSIMENWDPDESGGRDDFHEKSWKYTLAGYTLHLTTGILRS